MPRSFVVTKEVDELFELTYREVSTTYDQRDNTEGKKYTEKVKSFETEEEAREWYRNNETGTGELVKITKIPW